MCKGSLIIFLFWTYLNIKSHYLEYKLSQQDVIQSFNAKEWLFGLKKSENFKLLGRIRTTDVFPSIVVAYFSAFLSNRVALDLL